MAKYVDGFVFVVPKDKTEEYKKMAEEGARMWKSLGALEYFECKGEDLAPKSADGKSQLGFATLTKAEPDETVWFSFIVFKSKKHRDEVNAKINEQMNNELDVYKESMPFDIARLAYGGFEVVVEG